MKPIIGVTPDYNAGDREDMGGKHPTYFLRARYMKAIEDAGGIPLILPLIDHPSAWKQMLRTVDGLMMTGSGSDLSPDLYGEKQRYTFKRMSVERATLELGLAKLAFKNDIPMLGVCGGMQSIAVALGGTLFQDINSQLTTTIPHQPTWSATRTAHGITITPRSLLFRIIGKEKIRVNSSHHQSVKTVPRRLICTAQSSDGVIEAIEAPDKQFFLGVQWHPEFLHDRDPLQLRIFRALVRASQKQVRHPVK